MPQQHAISRADSATSAPKGHTATAFWLATALLTAQGALIAMILILPATLVTPRRPKHKHKHKHAPSPCRGP